MSLARERPPRRQTTIAPTSHAFILTALILLTAPPVNATDDAPLTAKLHTETLHYQGATQLHQDNAHLHAQSNTLQATLTAEEVHIHTHWEEGQRVNLGPNPQITQNRGHEHANETHATIHLAPLATSTAQLLALPHEATITAQSHHESHQRILPEDVTIAQAGYSNNTQTLQTDEKPPGFQHDLSEATPTHRGLDQATIQGDFTLFTHNQTLTVQPQHGPTWTTWTGYQANPQAATADYELRITKIHAQNATLTLDQPDTITLLARTLHTTHEGLLETHQTTGLLETPEHILPLDHERLLLQGQGTTQTTTHSQPRLSTTIQGTYDPLLEAHTPPPPTDTTTTTLKTPLALLAGTLLASVLTHRYPYPLRLLDPRRKQRLYDRWEIAGVRNEHEKPAKAKRCFDRLIRLAPQYAEGWHGLARIENRQNPEDALFTLQRAKETLNEFSTALQEIEIDAAYHADYLGYAKEKLLDLAHHDPHNAKLLLQERRLPHLANDPDIQHALPPPRKDDRGGSPAYA